MSSLEGRAREIDNLTRRQSVIYGMVLLTGSYIPSNERTLSRSPENPDRSWISASYILSVSNLFMDANVKQILMAS